MRTRRRPTRTVRQPGQTQEPAYRDFHPLTVCRDTPSDAATSVTVAPASTASTARYLCSTTDNSTSANPGLPTRAATTRTENPITATVNHQLGPNCQASPGIGQPHASY